ncbi:MAG: BadM/Rrf2 family transcriptional regulator [Bdellovibrio sp. CG12_big_fil_rev_8_21_14_0_65_39_13]|nr:MAG: BadM/Rrf2 family transcriptional regulator [Bdellovibrio sp. CG22_combo_CG10-13_8_21_14_all_39_27]PIQ62172.1 MAG: BadM/Rrf2 family transcriptional regulator [Bdellovibrio sp. CG12_big_fil_rev_8_21_14_0_65_39_13]
MKLTLKTDYALRVLIFLQNKEKATIKEIAEFYNIKKNHLNVVVNRLSELGYINSSTGPTGGVSLKPQTLQKSVGEIILHFEEFELVECFNNESNQCRLNPGCKLKSVLKKANRQFIDELNKHKLQDLV